jgi:hypothetical protein
MKLTDITTKNNNASKPLISISIISHQHEDYVKLILQDLEKYCSEFIEVILTLNIPEPSDSKNWPEINFPLYCIHNKKPKGFANNHNVAFQSSNASYFCILNPDVRLIENPFQILINDLSDQQIGIVSPAVIDNQGALQDNARHFPTPLRIVNRILRKEKKLDYSTKELVINPDWIAGMFMLCRHEVFKEIGGFDANYYLYCEDVDLCARLKHKGYRILLDTRTRVIHACQRKSHVHWRYFSWHIASLLRFFTKYYLVYR